MIHKKGLFSILISALIVTVVCALAPVNASAQKAHVKALVESVQRPLYADYKGVRIGMTTEEVRAKLGKPTLPGDDQDYYIVSQTETVQIAYDAGHKAIAISVDFIEGIGAPDYKAVVGPDVQVQPDGSMHKLVFYESLGFWVSYNRSAGGVTTVTITIQKIINQ
jgi:outer membrane protein assembly factor BamE (lipoprotein component of BamABCDE complex)